MSRVPGTRRSRRRYARLTAAYVNVIVKNFRSLESIDEATKRRIHRPLRECAKRLSRVNAWRFVLARHAEGLALIILFTASVAGPALAALWLDPSFSIWIWSGVITAYLVAFGLAAQITVAPFTRPALSRFMGRYWLPWFLLVSTVSGLMVYGVVRLLGNHAPLEFAAVAALLGALVFVGLTTAFGVASGALVYAGKSVLMRLHPEAVIVDSFLGALITVERRGQTWSDLGFKHDVMAQLEWAAASIEIFLPRRLPSGDPLTDAWLKERGEQMAAAVRFEKKGLLSSDGGQRDRFTAWLGRSLAASVLGEWDRMGRRQPELIAEPRRYSRMVDVVATLLRAGVPGLLFLALQQSPYAVEGQTADYATAAVLIWAAITLLARFDPLFSAKIAAFKDVGQFVAALPGRPK